VPDRGRLRLLRRLVCAAAPPPPAPGPGPHCAPPPHPERRHPRARPPVDLPGAKAPCRRPRRFRGRPPPPPPAAPPGRPAGAGALEGGYVFPQFLPTYDAVAALCKLLELLAPVEQPLSELVAELPTPTLIHREVRCPWAMKGLVMRVLTERLKGRELDLLDGIKVYDERGWAQVLPDPDEPLP